MLNDIYIFSLRNFELQGFLGVLLYLPRCLDLLAAFDAFEGSSSKVVDEGPPIQTGARAR